MIRGPIERASETSMVLVRYRLYPLIIVLFFNLLPQPIPARLQARVVSHSVLPIMTLSPTS